jgi:hypothetical protein
MDQAIIGPYSPLTNIGVPGVEQRGDDAGDEFRGRAE